MSKIYYLFLISQNIINSPISPYSFIVIRFTGFGGDTAFHPPFYAEKIA